MNMGLEESNTCRLERRFIELGNAFGDTVKMSSQFENYSFLDFWVTSAVISFVSIKSLR